LKHDQRSQEAITVTVVNEFSASHGYSYEAATG
jgi:hypothetical protein